MDKIQMFQSDGWSLLDIDSKGEAAFSYLEGDCVIKSLVNSYRTGSDLTTIFGFVDARVDTSIFTKGKCGTFTSQGHVVNYNLYLAATKQISFRLICILSVDDVYIVVDSISENVTSIEYLLTHVSEFCNSLNLELLASDYGFLESAGKRVKIKALSDFTLNCNSNSESLFYTTARDFAVITLLTNEDAVFEATKVAEQLAGMECELVQSRDSLLRGEKYCIYVRQQYVGVLVSSLINIDNDLSLSFIVYSPADSHLALDSVEHYFDCEVVHSAD